MREHAGARGERTFARVLGLYVDHLEATTRRRSPSSGLADRETLLDLIRLLANNPLERVARTVGRARRPAGAARAACTSSSRACTTSGAAGTGSSWCAPRRRRQPGDKRPLRGFTETVETLGAAGARPLPRRRREHHRRAAARATARSRPAPRWASTPCATSGRPRLATASCWPASRSCATCSCIRRCCSTRRRTRAAAQFTEVARQPARRPHAGARGVALLPGAGRAARSSSSTSTSASSGLGLSLANLFEVASDEEIAAGPDAVYLYGVPPAALARFGELPTVFHDDAASRLLVAAVPLEDRFGYFGYLKKMVLTLHNVAAMDRGVMPFHGAYARLVLADGSRGQRAPHRRHGDRQVGDAGGAARRRRRAASARCASSPTTWARSRSAPTAACSATAPRSAPSCASTTCSRGTPSASSTAPSS